MKTSFNIFKWIRFQRARLIDKYIHRRHFIKTDFCLISNNCWGSMHFYQRFDIKYNIPTVGLFISDTDFIKFCNDLPFYLSQPIKFISPEQSPAYEEVCQWGKLNPQNNHFFNFPVGIIQDVTIWFMHYKSEEDAKLKWDRRAKRTDINKVIIKWSQRYTENDELVKRFLQLPYPKFGIVDKSCKVNSDELIKLEGWKELRDQGGDEISYTGTRINTIDVINKTLSN